MKPSANQVTLKFDGIDFGAVLDFEKFVQLMRERARKSHITTPRSAAHHTAVRSRPLTAYSTTRICTMAPGAAPS